MTDQTQTRLTAAEFAQLPETNLPVELIEGEVIMSPAPTSEHQIVAGELYSLLREIVAGGRVFFAPLDVYLNENNAVQPDVFWVAPESRCVEREGRYHGPPDLVVEVVLPSSLRHDRSVKFLLYEKHGVAEYWIADPVAGKLEVWSLKDVEYTLVGAYGDGTQFTSPRLGCEVRLSGVFAAM